MESDQVIQWVTAFGGGSLTLHLVKSLTDRYQGRLKAKQARERARERALEERDEALEAETRRAREWESAAWATRVMAIRCGVDEDDLPEFPEPNRK